MKDARHKSIYEIQGQSKLMYEVGVKKFCLG